jgi:hypothetical protein
MGSVSHHLSNAPLGAPVETKGRRGLCLSACSAPTHYAPLLSHRKTPWYASGQLASPREFACIKPNIMVVNTDVLNSWKEVATYLGRGIRTVQRWERELGLPVRRPRGKSRSPVIAFRPELDHWLQNAPMAERLSSRENQAAETSQAASSNLQEAA